jgi:bile acid:Na+ symporter, BASS family
MNAQKLIAITLLVSMMFDAGLQARPADFAVWAKSRGLFLRALLGNFFIIPIVGVLVCRLFHLSDAIATGLLLMAIAPGVPFVILAGGRQKGGSNELAILLAIALPLLATFTVPITMPLVLPGPERFDVPPGQLVSLLLFQVVPLLAGLVVSIRFTALAPKLSRIAKPLTMVALVALLIVLGPTIVKSAAAVFGSFGMLAMLVTVLLSLATGWFLGGPLREHRVTLAFGTALRNPAIAVAIAGVMSPSELISASVVTYFLVQALVAASFGAVVGKLRPPSS